MKKLISLLFIGLFILMTSCEDVYDKELISSRPTVLVKSLSSTVVSTVKDGIWISIATTLYDSLLAKSMKCQYGTPLRNDFVKFDLNGNVTDSLLSQPFTYFQNYASNSNPVQFSPRATGSLEISLYDENLKINDTFFIEVSGRLNGFRIEFATNYIKHIGNGTFLIPFIVRKEKSYKTGYMYAKEGQVLAYYESDVYEADSVYLWDVSKDAAGKPLFLVSQTTGQKPTAVIFSFDGANSKLIRDLEFAVKGPSLKFYNNGNKEGLYLFPQNNQSSVEQFSLDFYSYKEKKLIPDMKVTPKLPVTSYWSLDSYSNQDKTYIIINTPQKSSGGLYELSDSFEFKPVFMSKSVNRQLRIQATPNGLVAYELEEVRENGRTKSFLYVHKSLTDVKKIQLTESITALQCYDWD